MDVNRARPLFEAMIANLFWGFGFTATIWALQSFSIHQILFFRFSIVGGLGLAWALLKSPQSLRKGLLITFVPALFLLMEILFQVWGLKHTTATNAGFLTVTYIVMVPILERIIFGNAVSKKHWFWVAVAIVGTAMMVRAGESTSLNYGDFLMLLSALGASLHMLSVDRIGKEQDQLFFLNTMQSLWCAVLLLPTMFLNLGSQPPAEISMKSLGGLMSLTFGSTLLAFYFQMKAQKSLSPSISSLLFLVESPISAAFGLALLNETMSIEQWLGCVLILGSAAGVVQGYLESQKR